MEVISWSFLIVSWRLLGSEQVDVASAVELLTTIPILDVTKNLFGKTEGGTEEANGKLIIERV